MAGGLPSIDKPEPRNIRKTDATTLPFLFLTIPSLWLMWSVPPLWRGVDAYNQTVRPPGLVTILLHGPLYCSLSRIPLWFGYLISGSGPAESLGYFIKHSQLTDAGVYLLVVLQRCLFDLRDRKNVATAAVPCGFVRRPAAVLRVCALCRFGSAEHDRHFVSGRKRCSLDAALPRYRSTRLDHLLRIARCCVLDASC